ncbi:hypothetical protein FIBSPDRAFT_796861 [Athelia psychrophila]|uniref:Uncharacterized protein n=1 Tax=Athelia psychrophila TaxID=1759441 RepID=A0A166D2Q8_9AGAM|nr:hypothetical protein FIBSPDRAFT_796861 [Fibularhizoctonia sp. CBS 109695]
MHPWLIYLVLSYLAHFSAATSSNRTVDDQFGDSVTNLLPVYSTGWSQGATCSVCYVHLNASNVFNGTWHDTTYIPTSMVPPSVAISFEGTAVYAYCVLGNTVPKTVTLTNLTFLMDGELVGTYQHTPTTSADYQYNVPVYVATSLSNEQHVLTIEAAGTTNSLILFDYVEYTFDSTPSVPSHIGAIVGGAVGAIAVIAIGLLAFLLHRRRQEKKKHKNGPSS